MHTEEYESDESADNDFRLKPSPSTEVISLICQFAYGFCDVTRVHALIDVMIQNRGQA
jgi:hypothetical protein